jgi:hypothetical protein
MRRAIAILLLLLAACWSPRQFAPRERIDATGPGGRPAASYAFLPVDGTPTAELRVWSQGAEAKFTADDREVVELHVGFELENNGQAPLQLDLGSIVCEELSLAGVLQPPLVPVRLQGDGSALPGATVRVDAVFEPGTTYPRKIDSFTVRFQVLGDGGIVLRQQTPFGPWVRSFDREPAWGYGPAIGVGFVVHRHWW